MLLDSLWNVAIKIQIIESFNILTTKKLRIVLEYNLNTVFFWSMIKQSNKKVQSMRKWTHKQVKLWDYKL